MRLLWGFVCGMVIAGGISSCSRAAHGPSSAMVSFDTSANHAISIVVNKAHELRTFSYITFEHRLH